MAVFKVEGGHRLRGEITPQGAKNEALQILCATLLTPQRVVVRNIPRILDVMQLIELLRCMGAGALTVFFGGAGADGLAAAVFALALCLLQMYLPLICKNKVLFNFLAAFCVGSLISLACRALPALHGDKIIIGDIMLLIPGLAFTNAVKDIFIGDTISGVMRLIETVLWAAALALGFALSGWLLGV